MTIQETIDQLNAVPVERRGEKLRIHVRDRLSGYLDAEFIYLDTDEDYISVVAESTFRPEG